tara:strand:+ start:1972 stop:2091 length:120 start_codon:yes stop_codon:yes gene_type:complete
MDRLAKRKLIKRQLAKKKTKKPKTTTAPKAEKKEEATGE